MSTTALPFADPDMEYVGVGKLRQSMTAKSLEELHKPLAITGPNRAKPIAVMITWEQYMGVVHRFLKGSPRD